MLLLGILAGAIGAGPAAKPDDPPFPLGEAATRAESASITLRSIETQINTDDVPAQIESQEPLLTTEIDNRLDESQILLSASPTLQVLGEQEADWSAIDRNLDDWKHAIQQRLDQIKQSQAQISLLKTTWDKERTIVDTYRKTGKGTDLLQTAQATVDQTEAMIDRTRDDAQNAAIHLFAIFQAADVQDARVLEVLNSVRQARSDAFNRLLTRNSPAIWQLRQPGSDARGVVQQGEDSFWRQLLALRAYISQRMQNVGAQIGLLIVLTASLFWLARRSRAWADKDPQLEAPLRVFASPIATALVLALLGSLWIYPQAPRLFWAIVGATALVPAVLILRQLIERRWFPLLDALVVFYFFDQLRSVAAVVPIAARAALAVEMAGGALLLLFFNRAAARAPLNPRFAAAIHLFSWVWMSVVLLALLGDVIGYVSLANLLGDAALGSAYLAVIVYAGRSIVSGLVVIALNSRPLSMLRMFRQNQRMIQRRVNRLVTFTAWAAWVFGVLASLSVATASLELLRKMLAAQFVYGELSLSLGHVLAFAVTIWLSIILSRFVRFVLEEDVYDRFALPGGIPYAISKVLNYCILLIGFFIAVSALGYDMTKFTILAGAFGVGLGFGMQNIVNNFVSGLILLFERPVKVGDVIQMGDTTGVVGHIGIRASVIRTLNSSEIIVPNGNLISNNVTNWTLSNRQRGIEISIAAGAGVDPVKVIALLGKVAAATTGIITNPPPEVFLTTFSADAYTYQLHAWTDQAERWIQIRSDLSVAIHAAMVRENIPIK